ncbi:MAG: SDR family oxidoreductase [Desulfobacterales bacterium]|jgi:NAD(P)-dependent dehydrogenase (short-subunit alcohol dehydrogenase family)
MPDHDKRVALVTGANRGLGFAISQGLAEHGITVILGARDSQKGAQACSRLKRKGWDADFEILDVVKEKSIQTAVSHIQARFGRLDILVNNAGIMIDSEESVLNVSWHTIEKTLQTNVIGPLRLCRRSIPLMRAGGYGRIVNLASSLGSLTEMADSDSTATMVRTPAYRISKAALNCITILIAREVRNDNILVNSACPGWVRTELGGKEAPLTPRQGADTPVWLATLPDDGPTGGFFRERERISW